MMTILNVIKDGVAIENSRFHGECTTMVERYAKKKYSNIHAISARGKKVEVFLKGNKNPSIMDLLNMGGNS